MNCMARNDVKVALSRKFEPCFGFETYITCYFAKENDDVGVIIKKKTTQKHKKRQRGWLRTEKFRELKHRPFLTTDSTRHVIFPGAYCRLFICSVKLEIQKRKTLYWRVSKSAKRYCSRRPWFEKVCDQALY